MAKQSGELYPPKMLFLLVCGINLHLGDVRGKWLSTNWITAIEGKTTFLEVMFYHICVYLYVPF